LLEQPHRIKIYHCWINTRIEKNHWGENLIDYADVIIKNAILAQF
jgi:hypothetical protein